MQRSIAIDRVVVKFTVCDHSYLAGTEGAYSAVYYLNSTNAYVLAASVLRSRSLVVDVELPETQWLEELRFKKNWLIDGSTAVTQHMYLKGERYIMSARCHPKNSLINGDGFNEDKRTFMKHDTVTFEGHLSDECSVYMVQGLPWSAVARAATPCFAWQGIFVAMCALKVVALTALCYKAYQPFLKIVVNNKFVAAARSNRRKRATFTQMSRVSKDIASPDINTDYAPLVASTASTTPPLYAAAAPAIAQAIMSQESKAPSPSFSTNTAHLYRASLLTAASTTAAPGATAVLMNTAKVETRDAATDVDMTHDTFSCCP
eukprot:11370-Heterococcus_DN1.PRE.8